MYSRWFFKWNSSSGSTKRSRKKLHHYNDNNNLNKYSELLKRNSSSGRVIQEPQASSMMPSPQSQTLYAGGQDQIFAVFQHRAVWSTRAGQHPWRRELQQLLVVLRERVPEEHVADGRIPWVEGWRVPLVKGRQPRARWRKVRVRGNPKILWRCLGAVECVRHGGRDGNERVAHGWSRHFKCLWCRGAGMTVVAMRLWQRGVVCPFGGIYGTANFVAKNV